MILAAAACGEDPRPKPPEPPPTPPSELRLAWQSVSYHALPEAGGILDQPAGLLSKMTHLYNVWFAHKAYRQHDLRKHKEWVEANPELYAIILQVNKLREEQHA